MRYANGKVWSAILLAKIKKRIISMKPSFSSAGIAPGFANIAICDF